MNNTGRYNESSGVMLLARPSDTFRLSVLNALSAQNIECVVCADIFELIAHFETNPCETLTFLITRPAMVSPQMIDYLQRCQTPVCLMGYLDMHEHAADAAFISAINLGILMFSRVDQVRLMISRIQDIMNHCECPSLEQNKQSLSKSLQDVLSDDELNALLRAV